LNSIFSNAAEEEASRLTHQDKIVYKNKRREERKAKMLSNLLKLTAVDAATSVTLSDKDKQQLLDLHNTERAKYGVSALLWDEAIAQHSSEYGLTCVYKQSSADDRVYISQASPVVHGTQKAIYHGENIAGMSNGYTNCDDLFKSCYCIA